MAFKDVLVQEMQRAGFTKAKLARSLAVNAAAVTRWTNGETHPSGKSFARLVKVLPRMHKAFDD